MRRTFTHTFGHTGREMFEIFLPFDPREVFGKARAPVKVTINGYTYRSTIANMGKGALIPLRESNRVAAGVERGETVEIILELDTEKREVIAPADLEAALKSAGAWDRFREASFTDQKEHVAGIEDAKRPETRDKRIAAAVAYALARKPKA
jgi:hypothetical protein